MNPAGKELISLFLVFTLLTINCAKRLLFVIIDKGGLDERKINCFIRLDFCLIHTGNNWQSQNEIEKKFNFVYESLKHIQKDYVTDIMKALAFLILCIGWFITSDKSRNFFRKNRALRISSIIALIIICAIHINSQISTYIYSQQIFNDLSDMNYFDSIYYRSYQITIDQLIANSVMNTILFAVLILILFSLKKEKDES